MRVLSIVICLIILFNVVPVFAIDSQNDESGIILHKLDTINSTLFHHNEESSKEAFLGIGYSLLALAISLIFSGLAGYQAWKNTKTTNEFIERNRLLQEANMAYNVNDYDNAEKAYKKILEKYTDDIGVLLMTGNTLSNLKRYAEAIVYYDKILKIDKTYDRALNNKGVALGAMGDHDNALKFYQKSLEVNSHYADTLNNIGVEHMDSKAEYKKGLEYFDKALEIEPTNITFLANKAKTLNELERFNEAIKICDDAISFSKGTIKTHQDYHKVLSEKGVSYFKQKKYAEAIACFSIVLKINPVNDLALLNMGASLIQIGQFIQAMPYLNEYFVLNRNDALAIYNTGLGYIRSGYPQQMAIPFFEESVRRDPDFLDGHFNLGTAYLLIKNPEKALPAFEQAKRLAPCRIDVLTNMGICLFNLGQYERAIFECFNEVFKIDHHNLVALKYMGDSFEKLNNIPMATLCLKIYSMLL